MRRVSCILLLLVLKASCLMAQAHRPESGRVTGRVLLAETSSPARLAHVLLVPVYDTAPIEAAKAREQFKPVHEASTSIVQAGLDGGFVLTQVKPGNYYLVAQRSGYLQPLALLTREQLNKPDAAAQKLIERLLVPVTVAANRTVQAEARLYRGAALTGQVQFEDGSAASNVPLKVLSKDASGKWKPVNIQQTGDFGPRRTDDQGHFRIVGLPAGEYLLAASLQLQDMQVGSLFSNQTSSMWKAGFSVDTFYGDCFRTRDAKTIKVGEGDDLNGLTLTVKLSTLHTLSGSLLETANGAQINAGKLSLFWKDDDAELASTQVREEDNAFRFDYVPEGEYVLRVKDARDVVRTVVPNCEGCMPETQTEEKLVRSFGNTEQPLIVMGDMPTLNIAVPAASPASASVSSAAKSTLR